MEIIKEFRKLEALINNRIAIIKAIKEVDLLKYDYGKGGGKGIILKEHEQSIYNKKLHLEYISKVIDDDLTNNHLDVFKLLLKNDLDKKLSDVEKEINSYSINTK